MDYLETNREAWDKRTAIHVKSAFYDVDGFLAGNTSLREIELREMGDVAGKSLLHLQCHFGLDTLSWARMGARVAGVDLAPAAIAEATALTEKTGLEADFFCADLYTFGANNHRNYDIVFTSYGVLCWLPDLAAWAQTIATSLEPGGRFYMVEFHPVYDLIAGYSYFNRPDPDIEETGTYTENDTGETSTMMTWSHSLSDVINALVSAGLQIDAINEYPFSPYNCFDNMEEREPGRFYISHLDQQVPLIFSIQARREQD